MRKLALALLAALALTALPTDAHAGTCSKSLLYSYSHNWVTAQFSPALSCQWASSGALCYSQANPPPIGNGCWLPAQNATCFQCAQSGVTGWWDWNDATGCATSPDRINGKVQYRPNPAFYTYNYQCRCSEGVYSCGWL